MLLRLLEIFFIRNCNHLFFEISGGLNWAQKPRKFCCYQHENRAILLFQTPYFNTLFLVINGLIDVTLTHRNSLTIYICSTGILDLIYQDQNYPLKEGECILMPAVLDKVQLKGEWEALGNVSLEKPINN